MSGRMVTFDLDAALAKFKVFAEEAPGLITVLQSIWPGAASIGNFLPLASPVSQLLSKMVGTQDGLTLPGMPDTGPRGRGRLTYLRNSKSHSDEDVVKACEGIVNHGFTMSKGIADMVNYTLSCMYPDVEKSKWDSHQTRTAIDRILENDGLTEGVCDKLGDMINWALNNQPTK